MPAKITLPRFLSRTAHTRMPLYLISLVAVIGLVAWANGARAATPASSMNSAITPGLKLAAGTINLENTGEAVDKASAAKLLPLWQLLAQLESSSTAAPQEITAVIDEIKVNMTDPQIKAIDAMSFTEAEFGNVTTGMSSAKTSSTQTGSAASDPMLTGDMAAGSPPVDGGGPIPSGSSQSASASKSSASTSTSAVPAVIRQVIQLLETKVQS